MTEVCRLWMDGIAHKKTSANIEAFFQCSRRSGKGLGRVVRVEHRGGFKP